MFNNIQGINTESILSMMNSQNSSCGCNSSSNNTGFNMVLISLLKAVSKVNNSTTSTINTNIDNTTNNVNNNTNIDILNNVINNSSINNIDSIVNDNINTQNVVTNTGKIETTANDESTKTRIDNSIKLCSQKYGVDENLIRAIIKVESNFNPNCVSKAGAKGLMQLMPENCRDLKVSNPFNIEENIDGGTRHIKEYIDKYNGDIEMALMAYNGGPTRMARRGVKSISDIYKMPKETQNYVPKVMKYYKGE